MMRSERLAKTNVAPRGSSHGLRDDSLVEAAKSGHSMAFTTLSEGYRQQLFRAAIGSPGTVRTRKTQFKTHC